MQSSETVDIPETEVKKLVLSMKKKEYIRRYWWVGVGLFFASVVLGISLSLVGLSTFFSSLVIAAVGFSLLFVSSFLGHLCAIFVDFEQGEEMESYSSHAEIHTTLSRSSVNEIAQPVRAHSSSPAEVINKIIQFLEREPNNEPVLHRLRRDVEALEAQTPQTNPPF